MSRSSFTATDDIKTPRFPVRTRGFCILGDGCKKLQKYLIFVKIYAIIYLIITCYIVKVYRVTDYIRLWEEVRLA